MLKAILFDMDGVLVDSEPFHHTVETKIHQSLGITIPTAVRKNFTGLANNLMWAYIKKEFHLHQSIATLMDNALRIKMDELMQLPQFTPITGITELLHTLKENKIKLAIASSSQPQFIFTMLEKANLTGWFDVFISGDQVLQGKPAPDIFLEAAKQLRIAPSECIVIEDSTNGVKAAVAANMKCIGFQNPNSGEQDLTPADLIITDFSKLDFETLLSLISLHYSGH